MTYPVLVLIISVLIASIMLTKVIPNFAQAYTEFGSSLPMYTQLVIGFSETFSYIWPYLLASIISC